MKSPPLSVYMNWIINLDVCVTGNLTVNLNTFRPTHPLQRRRLIADVMPRTNETKVPFSATITPSSRHHSLLRILRIRTLSETW